MWLAEVGTVAYVTGMTEVAYVTEVTYVAGVAEVAGVAYVAEMADVAEVDRVDGVAGVLKWLEWLEWCRLVLREYDKTVELLADRTERLPPPPSLRTLGAYIDDRDQAGPCILLLTRLVLASCY